MKCFFSGCSNEAEVDSWKCTFHFRRGRCAVPDCRSQVYARHLCVRHGGKRQCQVDGCMQNCRVGLFCTRHSPSDIIRLCSEDGCNMQAHLRGKCFRHGGRRECAVDGCDTLARNRGFCAKHKPKDEPRRKAEDALPTRPRDAEPRDRRADFPSSSISNILGHDRSMRQLPPLLPPLHTLSMVASSRPHSTVLADVASLLEDYYAGSNRQH
ncbi:Aste57867_13928 [Aphanomyces stellatus]|uniref:Aste57867_13928 protein n=1 Tax=Aphanomyces stellatus TaxID=120398 RepID=A0A485L0B0_9STRA|nr:hypothetical protein As57867_013877 [Aphanomyces stellatus]VFT90758.1 Aste57867_13928 [Aphanomyces stellatus]